MASALISGLSSVFSLLARWDCADGCLRVDLEGEALILGVLLLPSVEEEAAKLSFVVGSCCELQLVALDRVKDVKLLLRQGDHDLVSTLIMDE